MLVKGAPDNENNFYGFFCNITDSKNNGANVGPTWGRQDPGGPHVGPRNLAIWDTAAWKGEPHIFLSYLMRLT